MAVAQSPSRHHCTTILVRQKEEAVTFGSADCSSVQISHSSVSDLVLDSPLFDFPEAETPPQTVKPLMWVFFIIHYHFFHFTLVCICLLSFSETASALRFTLKPFLLNMLLSHCTSKIITAAASSLVCLDMKNDCRCHHGVRNPKTSPKLLREAAADWPDPGVGCGRCKPQRAPVFFLLFSLANLR